VRFHPQALRFHRAGARVILSARRDAELQRVKTMCLAQAGDSLLEPVILPLDLARFVFSLPIYLLLHCSVLLLLLLLCMLSSHDVLCQNIFPKSCWCSTFCLPLALEIRPGDMVSKASEAVKLVGGRNIDILINNVRLTLPTTL
jgi:NAD(P)-dependent dehydrogenase (short-subunit alcohol dehydrogenase family)